MNAECAFRVNRRIRTWLLSSLLAFIVYHSSFAQVGTWRTHFSYRSAQSVAVVGEKVYAATQNGLFYYDKTTGQTTLLTRQEGLNDAGINRLLYLADQSRLLIAYRSGNLDFLRVSNTGEPGEVTNLNTIATATQLPAARNIYHINHVGNNAYLSTDFGLVVLDIVRGEIGDTYFTRQNSNTFVPIYATAVANDSLYALTGTGNRSEVGYRLQAIRLARNVNIADPANWRPVQEPDELMSSLVASQGRLYVSVSRVGIYERQNGNWVLAQALSNPNIQLFPTETGLVVATNQFVTSPASGTLTGPILANPREAVADGNQVWVADQRNGLLEGNAGTFRAIALEGPASDQLPQLYTYPQNLIALNAEPTQTVSATSVSQLSGRFSVQDGRWQDISPPGTARSFNAAAYLATEQQLYLGSYGGGLWSQSADGTLTAVTLPVSVRPFISSLAADANGNLWLATPTLTAGQPSLHVRRPDGTFQSYNPRASSTEQIVIDDNGFLWLRQAPASGIVVFDPATNRSRVLNTGDDTGKLPNGTVNALVKDRDGLIWAGTDNGVTVFDDPLGVFDRAVNANPPLLNRLFGNEIINAIAVDGGNRKWIGTRNGLYLISPDGSQLLETFTVNNSPLPTNSIQSLAIEPLTGEVFVATGTANQPAGLVSYRGTATEPAVALSNLTIFPNPVRPDYSGTVGINGLTNDATVKIFDAGGQLVYETRAAGGTATWNLRDYRGRSAQTGVYLIVVVGADGMEGLAGKLAVVR